jgi:DNA-directed RNA polymerase subunit alpha
MGAALSRFYKTDIYNLAAELCPLFDKFGEPFYHIGREPMGTRIPLNTKDSDAKGMADKLDMSTAEIGLSVRTTNCLEERGIFTVNDLLNCTREDLLSISNFGEKTLEEVYKALEGIGFYRRWKYETPCMANAAASEND